MSELSALRFSGRFIVSVTTGPSRSTMQCRVEMSSRTGMRVSWSRTGERGKRKRERILDFGPRLGDEPGDVAEMMHAPHVEVAVQARGVDEHRFDVRGPRAVDVRAGGVADVDRVARLDADPLERDMEDPRVGLGE